METVYGIKLEAIYVQCCLVARKPYMVQCINWCNCYLQASSPCGAMMADNKKKDVWRHILSFLEPEFPDK